MKLCQLKRLFCSVLIVIVLGTVLYSGNLISGFGRLTFLRGVAVEVQAACSDTDTQWIVAVCICIYLLTFLVLERRINPDSQGWCSSKVSLWLFALVGLALTHYTLTYDGASSSTEVLVLLTGMTLSKGAWVWVQWSHAKQAMANRTALILGILLLLLTSGACLQPEISQAYEYRGQVRWSGPWKNPNTFGMLMGLGVLLAIGKIVQSLTSKVQVDGNGECGVRSAEALWWLKFFFVIVAALVMSVGLLKSYSRGAWLALLCGLSYLGFEAVRNSLFQEARSVQWIRRNGFSLAVAVCALAVLAFWNYRHTERVVVARAFSVGNMNDFSWRNRVAAWEGALQMMADKPWFGFGWNQPERIYYNYYRADKVAEGAAIQMNDYFTLGTALGLPALACFVGYIWISISWSAKCGVRNPKQKSKVSIQGHDARMPTPGMGKLDWLQITCRAGAIVLLVGFWFEGGLFRLATAAPFWILLELGRQDLGTD